MTAKSLEAKPEIQASRRTVKVMRELRPAAFVSMEDLCLDVGLLSGNMTFALAADVDDDDVDAMTVVRWVRIETFLAALRRTKGGVRGKRLVPLITLSERRGFVVSRSASTIRLELARFKLPARNGLLLESELRNLVSCIR